MGSMAEAVFKKHDVNNDGKMDAKELQAALKELIVTASSNLLKAIMVHYDKAPKNGVLELNEFKNLVADMKAIQNSKREEVLDAFFKFDKDKSGFIEPNELKEVLTYLGLASGEEIVNTMIGVADSNKDGKISITELANVMGHTVVGAEDIQQWSE